MYLNLLFAVAGIAAVLLSWRARAPRESAHGEYYSMLLFSVGGMAVLVAAQNTVTLFLGFELLSIPLYVLCATEMRRATSLESGLKYLVIGSVGSATLVYGLALLYGATGSTDFGGMTRALDRGRNGTDIASDSLLLGGVALVLVGLAFKASVAPFHQWTPDVYEGAPTPITAFMAVATKAAAFGVLLRMMDVALLPVAEDWGAVLGGARDDLDRRRQRRRARAVVAEAPARVVERRAGGLPARGRRRRDAGRPRGDALLPRRLPRDEPRGVRRRDRARARDRARRPHRLGRTGSAWSRPWLAWPLTIAMLSLAGIPATGGFIGKVSLIEASVDGGWTWLAIVIVLGSAASLAYYLRVLAAMWMRPAGAVAAPRAPVPRSRAARPSSTRPRSRRRRRRRAVDRGRRRAARPRGHLELTLVAVVAAVATLAAGVYPDPLFDLVRDAGDSFAGLL